jgi:host factor-I protein
MNRRLFRPPLASVKEPYGPIGQQTQAQPRKKPAPPDQTNAENFYYVKQMQARTPVAVVLTDGEILHGTVEWYDRDCIKLTRYGNPNLLIYKHAIRYIYKDTEDAARGGTNGGGPNGNS